MAPDEFTIMSMEVKVKFKTWIAALVKSVTWNDPIGRILRVWRWQVLPGSSELILYCDKSIAQTTLCFRTFSTHRRSQVFSLANSFASSLTPQLAASLSPVSVNLFQRPTMFSGPSFHHINGLLRPISRCIIQRSPSSPEPMMLLSARPIVFAHRRLHSLRHLPEGQNVLTERTRRHWWDACSMSICNSLLRTRDIHTSAGEWFQACSISE